MTVYSSLRKIFVCAMAVAALLHTVQLFETQKYANASETDTISAWETRFVKLKQQLPVKNGTVGYIADFDIQGIETNIADQEAEYILAQYTMAPVVLERSMDHEWIMGNLSPQAYESWSASNEGKYEVIAFGNNLYLIHKNKP